jgi:FkbM family methyltransferase
MLRPHIQALGDELEGSVWIPAGAKFHLIPSNIEPALISSHRIGRIADRVRREGHRYMRAAETQRPAIRSEWRREIFFRLARPFTPTVEVEWPSGRFLLSTTDRDVSRVTFISGPFDLDGLHQVCERIRDVLGDQFDLSHGEVLEFGANIGTTSVPLVTELGAKRVHAFEPSPDNFRLLRENIIGNDLEDRIQPYQIALSDSIGMVPFELSPRNSGDHRIQATGQAVDEFNESSRAVIQVAAATVDSLVDDGTLSLNRVQLVWIDTQGHEALLLKGAQKLLATQIPIVIEYWPYALKRSQSLDLLHELVIGGYTHFLDTNDEANPRAKLAVTQEITKLPKTYAGANDATNLILFSL